VAALPTMLEHDRKQAGWSVGQAALRLGVSVGEYRELEAGARSSNFESWDRISSCTGGGGSVGARGWCGQIRSTDAKIVPSISSSRNHHALRASILSQLGLQTT
jgi:hypothetical protein